MPIYMTIRIALYCIRRSSTLYMLIGKSQSNKIIIIKHHHEADTLGYDRCTRRSGQEHFTPFQNFQEVEYLTTLAVVVTQIGAFRLGPGDRCHCRRDRVDTQIRTSSRVQQCMNNSFTNCLLIGWCNRFAKQHDETNIAPKLRIRFQFFHVV